MDSTSSATKPIIKIDSISKVFGQKKVLDNVSFDIMEGEIFGIIGVSGAGKTTLLETISGFQKPDSGNIFFRSDEVLLNKESITNYKSIIKDQNSIKRIYGFATQEPSFYEELTINENLDYFGSLYDIKNAVLKGNIATAINLVGLNEAKDRLAKNLSGGMQKRLDIACAMVHSPKVLILDEPTADLDIVLRRQMWDLVKQISKKGTTVIIASHFLDEIETLCDKLIILHNSTIIAQGKVKELKDRYSKNQEIYLETEKKEYEALQDHIEKKGYRTKKIFQKDGKLIIYSEDANEILKDILNLLEERKEKIIDVKLNEPTLNEIFESLTTNVNYSTNKDIEETIQNVKENKQDN